MCLKLPFRKQASTEVAPERLWVIEELPCTAAPISWLPRCSWGGRADRWRRRLVVGRKTLLNLANASRCQNRESRYFVSAAT